MNSIIFQSRSKCVFISYPLRPITFLSLIPRWVQSCWEQCIKHSKKFDTWWLLTMSNILIYPNYYIHGTLVNDNDFTNVDWCSLHYCGRIRKEKVDKNNWKEIEVGIGGLLLLLLLLLIPEMTLWDSNLLLSLFSVVFPCWLRQACQ